MATISVSQRKIWLCPFPFSDLSGTKVRPVLILSNAQYNSSNEDVIVCAITSHIKQHLSALTISQSHCESGILLQPSSVRVDTLFKLKKSLLKKSFCVLNRNTFQQVKEILQTLIE
jgi:mRNA interferase MazF